MKAAELLKGMTIETTRGVKVVASSTMTAGALQRIAFTDGQICQCPQDTEFYVYHDPKTSA